MSDDDITAALETARQAAETAGQTITALSRTLGRAYAELAGTGQDSEPVLRLLDSLEEAASHAAAMQFKAETREAYLNRADRDDVDDNLAEWVVRQLLASPTGSGNWIGAPGNPTRADKKHVRDLLGLTAAVVWANGKTVRGYKIIDQAKFDAYVAGHETVESCISNP